MTVWIAYNLFIVCIGGRERESVHTVVCITSYYHTVQVIHCDTSIPPSLVCPQFFSVVHAVLSGTQAWGRWDEFSRVQGDFGKHGSQRCAEYDCITCPRA